MLPLERLGLERQWFAVVPLVETERLLRISRTQDLLFAQTSYARLHAFDAETGRLLWSAELGERTGFARGVAANSWAVFVTNANMLFCARSRDRPADLADEPRARSRRARPPATSRGSWSG